MIDAPLDAPASDGHYHFVISRQYAPTSTTTSREYAFDLNGDGTRDNQLGDTMAALQSQAGYDFQSQADLAITHGTIIMLVDLDPRAATGSFTIDQGTNPDPAPCSGSAADRCGAHLMGTATFTAAPTPRDTPLSEAGSGSGAFGPGHLTVGLTVFGSTTITLVGARAQATALPTGFVGGKIGGAITMTDVDMKLYPAMQSGIAAFISRDCNMLTSPPSCGCAGGSQGATSIAFFDVNHDCSVTIDELKQNSLVQSLLQPDVTIEGQQAISFGFGVDAVFATFTP